MNRRGAERGSRLRRRGQRPEVRGQKAENRSLRCQSSVFSFPSSALNLLPLCVLCASAVNSFSLSVSPSPRLPVAANAPIHDIVDAVPYFPYPVWMAVSVVAGILVVVGGLVWFFFFRKPPLPELTPRELALAGLAKLAQEPLPSYEFAVRISEILRTYIDKNFGISATTATSMEFLNAIQDNAIFTDEERQALGQFLQTADLLKYARAEAESDELKQLFDAAERLVCGTMKTGRVGDEEER